MARFNLKFIRELQLAFAALMLVTLATAWYFNENVKRSGYEVQRVTLANNVMQGYLELSNLTLKELNALSDGVLLGEATSLQGRESSASALQEVISRVRHGVMAEVTFGWNTYEGGEPTFLVDIERQVEELIRSGALIEQALKDGRSGDAQSEMDSLRSTGFADNFISLVNKAISDQRFQLRNMNRESSPLLRDINRFLPILIVVVAAITFFIIVLLSRRYVRAVNALNQGATAFEKGVLSHRIPKLSGTEFQQLGEAFNMMTTRLSEHRKELQNSKLQREAMVDERTRELQISNMKLADADVKRRKLLADISHEFRTPITVIRGEADIALRGTNKTELDYADSFRRIIDQADNATRLVDDLLFIARADAGEPRLKLSLVSVSGMIEGVCQDFMVKAEKRGLKIRQGRMDSKAFVRGDANRLRQVFAILMDNALRYSKLGGRIEVQVVKSNEKVEISFRDEGIGFSEDHSELIFERFYRAPNAEAQASGTGLGLPVAKAIVQAHEGTITLKGKLDKGATAVVILPVTGQYGVTE